MRAAGHALSMAGLSRLIEREIHCLVWVSRCTDHIVADSEAVKFADEDRTIIVVRVIHVQCCVAVEAPDRRRCLSRVMVGGSGEAVDVRLGSRLLLTV